jgi:hypothetical protein
MSLTGKQARLEGEPSAQEVQIPVIVNTKSG